MPQPTHAATAEVRPKSGRSLVVRAMAACWLIAFAAFNIGIPLLDARMEHSNDAVVHLEDAGAASCPAAHSPDCIACHLMTGTRSLAAPRPTFALADHAVDVGTPVVPIGVRAAALRAVPSTRAPPQA